MNNLSLGILSEGSGSGNDSTGRFSEPPPGHCPGAGVLARLGLVVTRFLTTRESQPPTKQTVTSLDPRHGKCQTASEAAGLSHRVHRRWVWVVRAGIYDSLSEGKNGLSKQQQNGEKKPHHTRTNHSPLVRDLMTHRRALYFGESESARIGINLQEVALSSEEGDAEN
ncbi:hypothetical protein ZHAS_00015983 [Anopheles sinensis]|uniref:Uncharacterized protein n=1 Tax=Anopheles sinensis TaxID=74873 RepID=A0A084WCH8_ANOSI|nr:hypothetical protein ZHAS_00015983 [Anopheles sinensis]